MSKLGGSFRDPEGRIFVASGRIFRGVTNRGKKRVENFVQSNFYNDRAGSSIVKSWRINPAEVVEAGVSIDEVESWALWLEHEPLPLITYPYEWPFERLKTAACFTLDLLTDALDNGYTLKDASAYNIQFIDNKPVFIDILSFVEYEEGTPFVGYKQFCEQFFAPLCLTTFAGIDHNQWFRGRLDGLDLIEVSNALPFSTCFRMQVLLHVHLQARAMRKVKSTSVSQNAKSIKKQHRIPRQNLHALFNSIRSYVDRLERKHQTYWQNYSDRNSYDSRSNHEKTRIAREFLERNGSPPNRLLDLGCNTGEYSRLAIESGVRSVIGVDLDCGALDTATRQAQRDDLPAHFLFWDLANPSPNIGWKCEERMSLESRIGQVDAVFCFALIHHVVIGRNLPLEEFVCWVCAIAQRGLIEFVPKSDPMTQGLLRHREDVFDDYDRENFERILTKHTSSVIVHEIDQSARLILEYENSPE